MQSDSPLYTEDEVLRHFTDLLPALDLEREIAELGFGLNGIFKRRRSLDEFTSMCIAMWGLALERSFPEEAEVFFRSFLENSPTLGKGKKREESLARIMAYSALFDLRKENDFSPVARYMAGKLNPGTGDEKALLLKLSLTMRKLYKIIFDYLI
ncbi:MAG: hypothetical protein LBQ63_01650 [Deltaproteobacteria bacterium]|nr:hypothetical protein [Deltaproteobacteria bacterium]